MNRLVGVLNSGAVINVSITGVGPPGPQGPQGPQGPPGGETPEGAQAKVDAHASVTATESELGHVRLSDLVKHFVFTGTLTVGDWSGNDPPFTQTLEVSDILDTDIPTVDVVMSGTYSTDEARMEAWGNIYRAVTEDSAITFYSTEIPEVDLPVQIEVIR